MRNLFVVLMALITLLLIPSISSAATEAVTTGFTAGNDFLATDLHGDVSIRCQSGSEWSDGWYSCDAQILDPAEYSYFTTDAGGGADSVTLLATREDGSTREKKENYNPSKGRSKGAFNLWIVSLFQKPLLDMGVNRIHFKLTRDGAIEREGDFIATVRAGSPRVCRHGTLFSSDMNDCRSSFNACNEYFRRYNYCER